LLPYKLPPALHGNLCEVIAVRSRDKRRRATILPPFGITKMKVEITPSSFLSFGYVSISR
jgi:hypothetical protein